MRRIPMLGVWAVAVAFAAAAFAATGGAVRSADRPTPRDPFRPFILDLRPETPSEPLTPLERYELRQLNVAATMWDLDPPRALLEDDAGMGFIVVPGTPIGRRGGVIKAIEPGRVVVEERMVDFYGREHVREIVLRMNKKEEDGASAAASGGRPGRSRRGGSVDGTSPEVRTQGQGRE